MLYCINEKVHLLIQESQNVYSLYGINDGENTVAHPTSNL